MKAARRSFHSLTEMLLPPDRAVVVVVTMPLRWVVLCCMGRVECRCVCVCVCFWTQVCKVKLQQ